MAWDPFEVIDMKRTLHEVRQTDIIKIHGNLRRRSARYRHVVKVGVKGVMWPRFAISSFMLWANVM